MRVAVLVVAKGLDRQRLEVRALLGKHRRHLALGGAVDARVGPALLPVIEIGLRASTLSKRSPLSGVRCAWPTPASTLPLRSGSRDPARQRDDAVVGEHVAVERIERRVVPCRARSTPSLRLSSTTTRGAPPRRRNACSCSSAQIRALDAHVSRRTRLAAVAERQDEQPACGGTCRVAGSRTIGPSP